MRTYTPPEAKAQNVTIWMSAENYDHVMAETARTGLPRNQIINRIITQHFEAAAKREARRGRR